MIEGGCRCGACRYEIAVDQLPPVYACHCHICQRASGSAFAVQALVADGLLTVTGPVVLREVTNGEHRSEQRFCGECHARIYNTNTRHPGIAVVRGGTLDRSEELMCRAHIFTNYKQAWVQLDPAAPQWGEAPEPTAFLAVMRG